MSELANSVGIVVIGRNEGERLKRCLRSLVDCGHPLVYVDSGSSDGSVEFARHIGALVVELDTSTGFTAARARNAGFQRLVEVMPEVEYVQFVDGDCEVDGGWIPEAVRTLVKDQRLGVVCGRRRERFPERSVYNLLCDLEWDTPIGPALSCGGDALFRVSAFEQAGRFSADVIAGEEPELCVRLRALNHGVLRIDHEMTLHDANIMHFSQWWKRAVRSGHARAELAFRHHRMHGAPGVRVSAANLAWGVALPAGIVVLSFVSWRAAAAGALLYPVLMARVYVRSRGRGRSRRAAGAYAMACTVGKFAEAWGLLRFVATKASGRKSRIIEYKEGTIPPAASEVDARP